MYRQLSSSGTGSAASVQSFITQTIQQWFSAHD